MNKWIWEDERKEKETKRGNIYSREDLEIGFMSYEKNDSEESVS